ncbi:protein EPIDERMAL PATTERNING FACTOR [Musa troglodytarum]|uniref:Epidermal patterning factor-like protein n=1 Tax=Musa troglodytarum TaxID=320322 RepID=A0A9E7FEE2_9LILI|nr:protein EPIDERMAL PATTERNING FACTOR [Musa troglodytarum]
MRNCTPSRGVCLLGALFLLSTVCAGLRPNPDAMTAASDDRDNRRRAQDDPISKDTGGDGILKGLYATGSSLPDCSHACGPCSPCKRVTVIFKCSLAESCPVGYRCTCDGKYYHVPSN